jgi:hypothetical protein
VWNFVVAAILIVLEPVVLHAAVGSQGQIEGVVVQVFPSVVVIKNDEGQATVLQLTPRTQLTGPLKPGDRVVAYVTPYGVTSIQLKTSTVLVP